MFGPGFAKKVLDEINKVRPDPESISKKLIDMQKYFKGKILNLPKEAGIETTEGKDGYQQAADFLAKAPKLPALTVSPLVLKIAEESIDEMKKCENEEAMDKIDRRAIIKKYGHYDGRLGDSTDFGSSSPEMVMINLVVDDGNAKRTNRELIFRDDFKEIGIATAYHEEIGPFTFIILATDFSEGPGKYDDVLLPYEEESEKAAA